MLEWNHTGLWEDANRLLVGPNRYYGCVRLAHHHVVDLSVTEEEHNASLHHVLKDEVLVVIASLHDVAHHEIIKCCLPPGRSFIGLSIVIDLFLSHIRIQDLLVHPRSE